MLPEHDEPKAFAHVLDLGPNEDERPWKRERFSQASMPVLDAPAAPLTMQDYIRRARQAANAAAPEVPVQADEAKRMQTRLAIAGGVVVLLLIAGGMSLREFAVDSYPVMASDGVAHRHTHPVAIKGALTPLDLITEQARAGHPDAELAIGLKYLTGDGIQKDDGEAYKWIARAAATGNVTAEGWLGTLYAHGRGVKADPAQAVAWFQKAADQGNRKAMHDLANAYAEGTGVPTNYFEAARWFSRAADRGYVDSAFNLAVLYERGDGVPQSLLDAYKWYAIAAAEGDGESRTRMAAIASELSPDDVAAAQNAANAFKAQTPTTKS